MSTSKGMSAIVWNDDTTYGLFISRIITWPTGTWPLEEHVLYARIRSVITVTTLSSLAIMLLIEITGGHASTSENIYSLVLISSAINGCVKVSSFQIYAANMFRNYSAAVGDYATIDTSRKRDVMRRHAFMGRLIGCSMVLVAYACSTFFFCAPYFTKSTGAAKNASEGIEPYNKYPIPSTRISSLLTITPITYGIICITEFLLLTVMSTANLGSDSFFLSSLLHVCGQIQLLKLELADCHLETEKAEETLRTLTSRHRNLLILARLLVETISAALFVQLGISCVAICVIGLECILSLRSGATFMLWKSISVLLTLLLQLWCYSYVGDYLKTQTEDIGVYVYSSEWYSLPANLFRNLVFIIMRAQQPVQLTAARFISLNMQTYMSILKTSVSYLSVLRIMLDT